jgi:phosphoserine phosphatase RsbU/P
MPAPREFVIRDLEGRSSTITLADARVTLGRSTQNQLSYPDDVGLSRQHLALIYSDETGWTVEDLQSKNGTLRNGEPLVVPMPFAPGDRIAAGHLTIEFTAPAPLARTVVFVEQEAPAATTEVADLEDVLGDPSASGAGDALESLGQTQVMTGNPQTWALVRAGRELAGHRPLAELFDVIMDLAMSAVSAGRGVLMTLEGEALEVKAARGEGFAISKTVRDRVLNDKASILVRDAQLDQKLRLHQSIVDQRVRSILAVPLQTNDRVIGLLYLDSPHQVRDFTREDLNVLTVMANIAAIRIEHARLNEIEEAERALAKEMQQAAQIQAGLFPASAPKIEGLDVAAKAVPARQAGGDYFDFLRFPDGKLGLMVGDVAGKGMPAALLMSSLQARVHVLFEDSHDLAARIERLNKATCGNCPENRFITFFFGILDPATGELRYASAGHNPPVLVRANRDYELLPGGGLILGILPMAKYEENVATLHRGDTLVMFSDGVTEAPNPRDEEYGEERLAHLIASMPQASARELVQAVHSSVAQFTEGAPPADDITVVVARRL